jgi:hypothetical protein
VSIKRALGNPIGGTATVRVTKFQGTPKQSVEVFSVNVADPKPIQVRLEGGSRTELASVPADEVTQARLETTQDVTDVAPSGFNAGVAAGTDRLGGKANVALPAVVPLREASVPSGIDGLPGLRVEAKLAPDRQKVVMTANAVFTGPATDLPMPKIGLLPGGGE